MPKALVYTIGHSTHTSEYFLDLLKEYSVNCVIDVRSVAASWFNPQYNKKPLSGFLKQNHIIYLHFAEEFGARQTDPELLDSDGKVDFEKVHKSQNFKRGVGRLRMGIEKGFTIALMCAESQPLDCHRFSMISIALKNEGFEVWHILKNKTLISNTQLETLLLKKYQKQIRKADLFGSDIPQSDQLGVAYRLKNKEIGFASKLYKKN